MLPMRPDLKNSDFYTIKYCIYEISFISRNTVPGPGPAEFV